MEHFCLNTGGYVIRVERAAGGPDLIPSQRFSRSILPAETWDYSVRVHGGGFKLPDDAERVFNAPLLEEKNGEAVIRSHEFWSIYKKDELIFIKTLFPRNKSMNEGVLVVSPHSQEWDLWTDTTHKKADPLAWPLDGLLLYYITAFRGDILMHASGVEYNGKGYVFSGISGKGKTTIAKLWERAGARVIHDDRLVIRHTSKGIFIYSTPVYDNDEPRSAMPVSLFLLGHGKQNMIVPLDGSRAVSNVMSNCIQHNWSREMIYGLIKSLSELCEKIRVARLYFKPEVETVDFILKNEKN